MLAEVLSPTATAGAGAATIVLGVVSFSLRLLNQVQKSAAENQVNLIKERDKANAERKRADLRTDRANEAKNFYFRKYAEDHAKLAAMGVVPPVLEVAPVLEEDDEDEESDGDDAGITGSD